MTETISLDGAWEFQHDPAGDLTPAGLGLMRPVVVPLPWQAQFEDLRVTSGVGWYRRQFEVPADWRDEVILLRFGAVDYFAEVWLNGKQLGDHEGGYLPFGFEIQDRVFSDRLNELVVRVVDPGLDTEETFPKFRFAEIPHGKQSWYGPIGGIWQSVSLERHGASYVEGLRLTPSVSDQRVEIRCAVAHPVDGRLEIGIFDPDGVLVGEQVFSTSPDQQVYETNVDVPSPDLWDVDRPALYRAVAGLVSGGPRTVLTPAPSPSLMERGDFGGGILDRHAEVFGFRTIEARNGEILLNGRPIYLRGALDQAYYPGTIYTPPSDEFLRDRFQKAKELGLNCLRCHIKIEDPRYYQLADEMGLLVWTELPNWGGRRRSGTRHRTTRASARAHETLEGMIRRDWNHPSIICWTIVNEDWGTRVNDEPADRDWLRETYDFVKALDPHRLVVDNSACRPNFHVKSDLDDYHFYYAIPDHADQWASTVADFASRPAWSYSPHGDAVRSGQEPLVVSEFGNWGLPNVQNLIAGHGGEPWWFDTGAERGSGRTRGVVHPKGVLDRFVALGLDRVFGSFEQFVAASQEQQSQALKYEIEEMRRHDSIKGYVITELTDVHWECNGLLDLRNNPKCFHKQFGEINAADVIVPEVVPGTRRAFWSDEDARFVVTVSHFSPRNLDGAALCWWVDPVRNRGASERFGQATEDAPGRNVTIGLRMPKILPRGRIFRTGESGFQMPSPATPGCARLGCDLVDAAGAVAARNDLDLFVFPAALRRVQSERALHLVGPADRVATLSSRLAEMGYRIVADWRQADLVVGLGFGGALRSIVQDGGRALCLVDDAAAVTASLGRLEVVDRAGSGYEGDWASSFSWLDANRFVHRIPSGPRLDWAFASVVPDQVILGLDAEDIARDGLAGLFLGWIQKPAALALQVGLGRGERLLTTLRLANPKGDPLGVDPVATVLFQDFVDCVCSKRFGPALKVE